ncbi:unnamed protein product [Ilex paraguariensis]|uniref:Uncharacterized protein n=1 Tax=Ilex paraguariensis TaxID=185542 RepID=A0ABC8S1M5_9AQUA
MIQENQGRPAEAETNRHRQQQPHAKKQKKMPKRRVAHSRNNQLKQTPTESSNREQKNQSLNKRIAKPAAGGRENICSKAVTKEAKMALILQDKDPKEKPTDHNGIENVIMNLGRQPFRNNIKVPSIFIP